MVNAGCLALATLGGLLNVLARLATAYPDHKQKKEDIEYSKCFMRGALVVNLVLQIGSSGANVLAGLLGPVSIVLPTIVTSQMVFNMLFFGILRLEVFEKVKRVGTFVIMCATIMLQEVGPKVQEDQDIIALLSEPYAIVWACALGIVMVVSAVEVWWQTRKDESNRMGLFAWLLAAQITATVISTTAAKMFNLVGGVELVMAVVVWTICGVILLYSIVVQSTEVSQAQFVPVLVAGNILINAFTGIIIWEDWRVVVSWVGYIAVFFQLGFGCYLLSTYDLLSRYSHALSDNGMDSYPNHDHPALSLTKSEKSEPASVKAIEDSETMQGSENIKHETVEDLEAGHQLHASA